MSNKWFSILYIMAIGLNPSLGYVPTLHVCYLMDTKDKDLVEAIQKMTESIDLQVTQIQTALSAQVMRYYITGEKYNSENLFLTAENMDIRPLEDIIILAILGHGSNEDSTHYPTLAFAPKDKQAFTEIADLFLIKQPAYLLSIVNSCNAAPQSQEYLSISPPVTVPNWKVERQSADKYQKLFEKPLCTLAITYLSAQIGGITFVDSTGGTPFSALMESLRYWTAENQSETPTWDKILFTAQALTIQRTQAQDFLECPYLEIVRVQVQDGSIQRNGEGLKLCKQ